MAASESPDLLVGFAVTDDGARVWAQLGREWAYTSTEWAEDTDTFPLWEYLYRSVQAAVGDLFRVVFCGPSAAPDVVLAFSGAGEAGLPGTVRRGSSIYSIADDFLVEPAGLWPTIWVESDAAGFQPWVGTGRGDPFRSTRADELEILAFALRRDRGLADPSDALAPMIQSAILGPDGRPLTGADRQGALVLLRSPFSPARLREFGQRPERLHELTPRQFEELMAEVLTQHGFSVTLTASTRDGGIDIWAVKRERVASFLVGVECKKYTPGRPVGVGVVRSVATAIDVERASAGLIVTTSHFTSGARDLSERLGARMDLAEFERVAEWLAPS